MKPWQTLLSDGIQTLRQSDTDIERVISLRSEEIITLLVRYIREIELFNQAYGLVGTHKNEELVIKHILDSIAPLGIICRLLETVNSNKNALQIADAGSGAGLPGIPLAIALPDCHFTLIERMGRRAGFLWNTKAVLGLSNITVEEAELEKTAAGMDADGRFSLVTFRAFKPLEPKLMKTLFNTCAKEGIIAAYKGRRDKIEKEILQFMTNKKYNCEIFHYNVPFLSEERNLLVIKT